MKLKSMKIQSSKTSIFKVDVLILVPTVFLCIIGLITLLSTTVSSSGSFGDLSIVYKQLVAMGVGFIGFGILSMIDLSILKYWQVILPIYVATVALLVILLLFGPVINNVQRWLIIGGFQLQPSEIAKVTVVLTTAAVLSYKDRYNEWILFGISLLLTIPIVILIYMQPNGSMSLLTLVIWFLVAFTGLNNQLRNSVSLSIIGLLVAAFLTISITGNWLYILLAVAGLVIAIFAFYYKGNWKTYIVVSVLIGIVVGGLSTVMYKGVLKDYQKDRIEAFFNPEESSEDLLFNVNQAKIAIGSGQIMGKGFGNGTQSKRDFLPEHETDFIFASFAEEFGLVGTLFLLTMYGVIISRSLLASVDNKENAFFSMLLIGLTVKLILEIFINIGTNTGAIPATGIPLPLISSGGSITIMTLFSFGIIQSIINRSNSSKNVSKIIDNYDFIN